MQVLEVLKIEFFDPNKKDLEIDPVILKREIGPLKEGTAVYPVPPDDYIFKTAGIEITKEICERFLYFCNGGNCHSRLVPVFRGINSSVRLNPVFNPAGDLKMELVPEDIIPVSEMFFMDWKKIMSNVI